MYKILGETVADTLGFTTVGVSITMSAIEVLSSAHVNDGLHILASVGALFFLYYKIKNSRMDYKIKHRDYHNQTKKENDDKA